MKKDLLFVTVVTGVLLTVPAYAAVGIATIKGTKEGSVVNGMVRIVEKDDGIEIEAKVDGVPLGNHGFHIHETGDCGDEGKAAGGHFNPQQVMHGYLPKDGMMHAHAGDMGNITVAADGTGTLKEFLPGVHLTKDPNAMGRSVILHEKEDDMGQPTGNAGGRIGCGIIELLKDNI